MELSEPQYRRIALYLDGEDIELTAPEQSVANEINRIGRTLGTMLEVAPPREVIDRTTEKVLSEIALRRGRVIRLVRPVALAAAAVVLLAAAVMYLIPRPVGPSSIALELPADVMAQAYARSEQNMDLDLIGTEIDALAAEILVTRPPAQFEAELNALQENVETFWLEEAEQWPDEI